MHRPRGAHAGVCLSWCFFSSRRRHTRCLSDWSSDVCSSDLYTADRCPPKITPVTDPPVAGYYVAVFRHGSWLHPGSGKADHRALIRVLIGELNPVARNLPQIPVFLLPLAKRISCYEGNVAAVRLPIADGSRAS